MKKVKNRCDNNEFGIYWNKLMGINSKVCISTGTWKYPEIIIKNNIVSINALHMKEKDFSNFMEQYGEMIMKGKSGLPKW